MMKKFPLLWQRHMVKRLFFALAFCLLLLTLLFSLIDYSVHLSNIVREKGLTLSQITTYYLSFFIKFLPLLLPLSFLLALIHTLTAMNANRELVALGSAGVTRAQLLKPPLFVALLCTLILYTNFEYPYEEALSLVRSFDRKKVAEKSEIHISQMEDGSRLIYDHYDKVNKRLHDVIWIRSHSEIWKIKALSADKSDPVAYFADHLTRGKNGLIKAGSYQKIRLDGLVWKESKLEQGLIPISDCQMTLLARYLSNQKNQFKRGEVFTQLLIKIIAPLTTLLLVLALGPASMRYARAIPIYTLYASGLFGLFALTMLQISGTILGENEVIHPLFSILLPFLLLLLFFGERARRYIKNS